MGASINMKGHPINHSKNTSTKARKYLLMLLFAFAAAVIGVMALHLFRERRIFSILLKDKDAQIITLQILLKKERDHAKEVKHKTEEMKLKINSLRSQKAGLDAKLLEMHSLLSSIKEERKVMESLIDEKQSEINLLRRQQQQQQQPARSDEITTQALDKNDVTSTDSTNPPPPLPVNVSEDDPSNSVNSTTTNGQYVAQEHNRELGSELEKVESINSTTESTESDHHDLIQGSATSSDDREESNNQAHETEGGGDPQEIAATKLDTATKTVDAASKTGGTRHGSVIRNRRSGHSKEKRWKMLVKSRRSQAGRNRDKDQVKLSSTTSTVAEDVELLRRDENGAIDQSTGADAEEQSLVSNGEQTTSDERDAGSEHYQHYSEEVPVLEHDQENKPDKVVESVIEDIKESGEKDHEEAKQEEGTGGHDDQQPQEEEEEQLEF